MSVETTLPHPKRGFIKLEDTAVVTDTGYEIYGEGAPRLEQAGDGGVACPGRGAARAQAK